jgi:hypothetical protein
MQCRGGRDGPEPACNRPHRPHRPRPCRNPIRPPTTQLCPCGREAVRLAASYRGMVGPADRRGRRPWSSRVYFVYFRRKRRHQPGSNRLSLLTNSLFVYFFSTFCGAGFPGGASGRPSLFCDRLGDAGVGGFHLIRVSRASSAVASVGSAPEATRGAVAKKPNAGATISSSCR